MSGSNGDSPAAAKQRAAKVMGEMQKLYLQLVQETRSLKHLGDQRAEMQITAQVLEESLAMHAAFLENMRGRTEARLGVIRRGEPVQNGKPELAPEHGAFWLEFSRLCAALRRAEKVSGY